MIAVGATIPADNSARLRATDADNGRSRATALTRMLTERLDADADRLRAMFGRPDPARVRCCWLDDVLPHDSVQAAYERLPPLSAMVRRANRKERKFVIAELGALAPPVRDLVVAFAQQPVADSVAAIIGKARLEVDPRLYNGGLTAMMPGDFMCPHLDNSHDYARVRRRDVVLLFYLTPNWREADGGVLELWDRQSGGAPRPVGFRSNRLVILETTDRSWHSIRPVTGTQPRASLTSYFYAPPTEKAPLKLTRFTGWPGQPVRSTLFAAEFRMRSLATQVLGGRLTANRHTSQSASVPVLADLRTAGMPERMTDRTSRVEVE